MVVARVSRGLAPCVLVGTTLTQRWASEGTTLFVFKQDIGILAGRVMPGQREVLALLVIARSATGVGY
jgi:hypothetical protein